MSRALYYLSSSEATLESEVSPASDAAQSDEGTP